jgi:hypothetical protein
MTNARPELLRPRPPIADLVITTCFLALFAWGLLTAFDWSFRAGIFPRMVNTLGLGLCLLHLAAIWWRMRRPPASGPPPEGALVDDDHLETQDVEYAFASATGRAWGTALAWVAGFFLSLYMLGLFVTAPLFALLYLKLAARASTRLSAAYAVITIVVLYLAFEVMLGLPMPMGVFRS